MRLKMGENKKILVIRAKNHISKQKLNEFHKLWQKQLSEGLVVIPNDFEIVALDPNSLKPCEIGWVQTKKDLFWSKLLRRFKHE